MNLWGSTTYNDRDEIGIPFSSHESFMQDLFADQQIGNLEDDPMVCTPSWSHSTSVGTLSSHGRLEMVWGQQGGLKGEKSHQKATAGFLEDWGGYRTVVDCDIL